MPDLWDGAGGEDVSGGVGGVGMAKEIYEYRARAYLDEYASGVREQADYDYVLARFCYFQNMTRNFFWSSLQCVEKYLKSIAIYHEINMEKVFKSKGNDINFIFKHINKNFEIIACEKLWLQNVEEKILLNRNYHNDDRKYDSTDNLQSFLEKIFKFGMDRYNSSKTSASYLDIIKLDYLVYFLRLYCFPLGKHECIVSHPDIDVRLGRPGYEKIKKECDDGKKHYNYKDIKFKNEINIMFSDFLYKENYPFSGYNGNVSLFSYRNNHVYDRAKSKCFSGDDYQDIQAFCDFCEKIQKFIKINGIDNFNCDFDRAKNKL